MKQIKLFICLLLVSMTCALSAQTTGFNYQAVIRDAGFSPIGNTFGTAQVSILNGGTEVYRENHNISTDAVGLFNLIIGRGTALVGNFGTLDWGSGNRFVQVSVTINGTTYNFAQSELQAVPYAKVAERTLLGDGDASPTNEIQTLSITGNLISLSSGGGTISLPPNSGTDSQTLSVAGNDLSISNGNTITLPAGPAGPQGAAGTPGAAGTAGATGTPGATGPAGATGAQGPAGATGATGAPGPAGANGAQGLAGATGATGAQGLVGPAGAQGPAGSMGATGPQGPPGTPAPNYSGGAGINVAGAVITNTGDLSDINEIQAISIAGDVISLSNGGGSINLPPNSGTDSQTLSVAGNDLSISNGNTITLPAGPTGPAGPMGAAGAQGPMGVPGPQGAMGTAGPAGATGANGPQGDPGPAGPPGPTYSAGTGINISGNTIINTGDTDASDDLTTASVAGGDLSGPFSNLQIGANTIGTNEITNASITAADLAPGVIPVSL